MAIEVTVNGATHITDVDPLTSLLQFLRNDLGLLGTRFGCGQGSCGACFVLIDGFPAPSCDTPLSAVAARDVRTVESLASSAGPDPLQRAFLDEQAAQCGYCISGILMSATALLETHADPTEDQIKSALDRNLCRCGSHRRIIRAIQRAARCES